MNQTMVWKIVSLVGLILSGVGTLVANFGDGKQQEAMIEEKVNEAIGNRYPQEKVEEP